MMSLVATTYSANAAAWFRASDMSTARSFAAATLLQDGRVLVSGGYDGAYTNLTSAEIYDPINDTWTPTGAMSEGRYLHGATLLPDGRVLVTGGLSQTFGSASAEIYDPNSGTWSPAANLVYPVAANSALLLGNGKVIVVGSQDRGHIYDPILNTWSVTPQMPHPPFANVNKLEISLLSDGRIFATGGGVAQIYSPSTNAWTDAAFPMIVREGYFTATLLSDSRVLVCGGHNPNQAADFNVTTATAEIYNPLTNTWTATALMPLPRQGHIAFRLPSGKVLLAGGWPYNGAANFSVDIYDPATGKWNPDADMHFRRKTHSGVLLQDGRLLALGGHNNNAFFRSTETYEEGAFGAVVGGGRRRAVDSFLDYAGTYIQNRTSVVNDSHPGYAGDQIVVFLVIAGNGETVFPQTTQLTLNGVQLTLPNLPLQGVVPIRLTLTQPTNVLLGNIDGLAPGTTRTATDADRLIIKSNANLITP